MLQYGLFEPHSHSAHVRERESESVCVSVCVFCLLCSACLFSWADQVLSTGSSGRLGLMWAVLPMTATPGCADITLASSRNGPTESPYNLGRTKTTECDHINEVFTLYSVKQFLRKVIVTMIPRWPQSNKIKKFLIYLVVSASYYGPKPLMLFVCFLSVSAVFSSKNPYT